MRNVLQVHKCESLDGGKRKHEVSPEGALFRIAWSKFPKKSDMAGDNFDKMDKY